MQRWSSFAAPAVALILAASVSVVTTAEAAKIVRRQETKTEKKTKPPTAPIARDRDDAYRAKAVDPAGDFKSYPD